MQERASVCETWLERYAIEPKGMRAGWLNVLGAAPIFPRDVVLPIAGKRKYQRTVSSTQEYFALIEENAPKGDVWVGWSPANMYAIQGMDRVFGDIDSPDLEDALQRARRYEEWCMSEFDVQPAVIFTAGKGFHLHMTHDLVDVPDLGVIEGAGTVYSDAFAGLIQGSGAGPDYGPLKHRKSYPRVPYAMNLKATGIHRHPMFTVPVDLTWNLKEILQASAEIRITPFRVPHSKVLGDLLRPEVAKAVARQERLAKASPDVQKGIHDDLVQAAIAFSEAVGWKLVNAVGRIDGRRRVLSSLYIPALVKQTGGDRDAVMASVEQFIVLSEGNWPEYRRFAESAIKDCRLKDGSFRSPVGLRRFWQENSELRVDTKTREKSRLE